MCERKKGNGDESNESDGGAARRIGSDSLRPDRRRGVVSNCPQQSDSGLDCGSLIATLLHGAGYRTVGLTANPFLIREFGFAQGFDAFQFYPGPVFAGAWIDAFMVPKRADS